MLIYKATKTLDGYLPTLDHSADKSRAEPSSPPGVLRAAIDVFWEDPYRGRLAELPADRLLSPRPAHR